MSAGNLIGMVFNLFIFAAVWTGGGWVVDRLAVAFNSSIRLLPTLQDMVSGFSTVQMIYGILPVVAFLVIIINYYLNEHSMSSQEV
jgi:type II secretory pathway component PulF